MDALKGEHRGLYSALVIIEKYLPGNQAPQKLINDILKRIQEIAELKQKMNEHRDK